jgi:hypothetical protein
MKKYSFFSSTNSFYYLLQNFNKVKVDSRFSSENKWQVYGIAVSENGKIIYTNAIGGRYGK